MRNGLPPCRTRRSPRSPRQAGGGWGGRRWFILLLIGLLVGCSNVTPSVTPVPSATPTPLATPTPDTRLGGRVTVRLSGDIEKLTPLAAADNVEAGWLLGMLYSGLTRLDDQLRPQPGLAQDWKVSDDGLVITFTLRPDLRWSDNTPITSSDVRFTWERLRSWDVRLQVQANLREFLAAVNAPAPNTVVFVLNRHLADMLVGASFPVLPEHIWGSVPLDELEQTDLLDGPVASGPFVLQERWPGSAMVLARNPNYYGEAPFLDQVAFLVGPDEQVAETALRQGDLDVAVVSDETYHALQSRPSASPLTLSRYPARGFTFVAFNVQSGHPFADPLLRQAWSRALNKESLVAESTGGRGIPLISPVASYNWLYDPNVSWPAQDQAQAGKLLEQAGWTDTDDDGIVDKDGDPLSVNLYVRADAPDRVAAAELMAQELAQVGIDVQVAPADFGSVITGKTRPPYDFDVLCMQWAAMGPDPDLFYLFHSSQAWQGESDNRQNLYNFIGYRSDAADKLLLAGRDNYDLDVRRATYGQLQELLARDLPYYYLWADPVYIAAGASLKTADGPINWETPNFLWNVERWYIQR